jgi:hypothetical protein
MNFKYGLTFTLDPKTVGIDGVSKPSTMHKICICAYDKVRSHHLVITAKKLIIGHYKYSIHNLCSII